MANEPIIYTVHVEALMIDNKFVVLDIRVHNGNAYFCTRASNAPSVACRFVFVFAFGRVFHIMLATIRQAAVMNFCCDCHRHRVLFPSAEWRFGVLVFDCVHVFRAMIDTAFAK